MQNTCKTQNTHICSSRNDRILSSEYKYILSAREELGRHLGKWIAIVGTDIVYSGDDAKEGYDTARAKYPDRTPFILKIPKGDMIL